MQELPFRRADKFSHPGLIALFGALFLAFLPSAAVAEAETSGTLRLGDLFQRSGPAPLTRRLPGTRLGRSMIVVPDTSSWKIPPATPAAEEGTRLFEGMSSIPKIPLLIQEQGHRDLHAPEPGFRSSGRVAGEDLEAGLAMVSLANSFERLRVEYRLIPVAEPGVPPREPLVLLQSPGTDEEFAVPEGAWRLERDLWLEGDSLHKSREFYPEQRFVSRTTYVFEGTGVDEATIIRRDLKDEH